MPKPFHKQAFEKELGLEAPWQPGAATCLLLLLLLSSSSSSSSSLLLFPRNGVLPGEQQQPCIVKATSHEANRRALASTQFTLAGRKAQSPLCFS